MAVERLAEEAVAAPRMMEEVTGKLVEEVVRTMKEEEEPAKWVGL